MEMKVFTLRLTEDQLDSVTDRASELGISKNDYIRRLIDGDIDTKPDEILTELRALRKLIEEKL